MATFRDSFRLSLPESSQMVMSEFDSLLETHGLRPPAFWNKDMLARAAIMTLEEYNLHKDVLVRFYTEKYALNPPCPPTWTDEPNQMWQLD